MILDGSVLLGSLIAALLGCEATQSTSNTYSEYLNVTFQGVVLAFSRIYISVLPVVCSAVYM